MFHAERVEVKDKAYHKKCASCFNCSKPLSSRDLCEGSDGNIFCSSCYSRKFGAPGYRGGYLRMYFSERRSISSVWRFAYAGAGCGEWTDAASAEALRPCQNLDVSTIKGEEGGENTCKKCEGKVMMIGYWIFCRQSKSFGYLFFAFYRFLTLSVLRLKASPFIENASVASNVATLWAPAHYITLLKDPIRNCIAKSASKRTTRIQRCPKYTRIPQLSNLLMAEKMPVLVAKELFFRYRQQHLPLTRLQILFTLLSFCRPRKSISKAECITRNAFLAKIAVGQLISLFWRWDPMRISIATFVVTKYHGQATMPDHLTLLLFLVRMANLPIVQDVVER